MHKRYANPAPDLLLPSALILRSQFPPEAENLPHQEVEIGAPRAMVVDRDPQTVLPRTVVSEMAATPSSCSRSMISTLRRFKASSSRPGGR